jgi:hypothetical protein
VLRAMNEELNRSAVSTDRINMFVEERGTGDAVFELANAFEIRVARDLRPTRRS